MSNEIPPETMYKLAVLIDGDNISAKVIDDLMTKIAEFGTTNVKRIYGDWSSPLFKSWQKVLLDYAIQPVQQFAYTTNKNATDIVMIIDAMDLLYTGNFDGFCLVTSDSDFTPLAIRIRERGLIVYGFGEKKTPSAFVKACDKFIFIEVSASTTTEVSASTTTEVSASTTGEVSASTTGEVTPKFVALEVTEDLKALLSRCVSEAPSDEDDWSHLAHIGNLMGRQMPEFVPRNYGYRNLMTLMEETNLFEIKQSEAAPLVWYIRLKGNRNRVLTEAEPSFFDDCD